MLGRAEQVVDAVMLVVAAKRLVLGSVMVPLPPILRCVIAYA